MRLIQRGKFISSGVTVIIETERLTLDEITFSDILAVKKIVQDKDVMFHAYGYIFTDEQAYGWLNKQTERYKKYGFGKWGVSIKETNEIIGLCGFSMQEWKDRQVFELGYFFQKAYWHKGFATEAASACLKYAFSILNKSEVFSIISKTNIPSQNVAKRIGMNICGEFVKENIPHYIFSVKR